MPDRPHIMASRYGALKSWGNTPDRTARTAPARRQSPSSVEYWLDQLDPERFAHATDQQRLDAAEASRRAYFHKLALASVKARQRGGELRSQLIDTSRRIPITEVERLAGIEGGDSGGTAA